MRRAKSCDGLFLAMRLVRGQNLKELILRRQSSTWTGRCAIVLTLSRTRWTPLTRPG